MNDLKTMILALIDRGFSEQGLAERVGSSQPTIHRIRHGHQPRKATEIALKKFYRQQLGAVCSTEAKNPPSSAEVLAG